MSVERAREQLELAEGRWHGAIKEHTQPPPDAGYARRLRALADAAAQEQAHTGTPRGSASAGDPDRRGYLRRSSATLSGALRSRPMMCGSGSTRPSESLSRARTGVSVVAIAQAFGQLSATAWDLADAVEHHRRHRAPRAG